MAARAELRRLLAVERLEERLAVRLRIDVGELIVREPQPRRVARREIVQRRVLDDEVALAHRAVDARDRVARRAAEPRLRFRRLDLLADRPVEAAVEEHRVVVAAGAPLRRLRADDVLHVLDRFAIPLVVERREVMRRRRPLLVDVAVAAAAHLARLKEARRDRAVDVRVRRRREERARGAGAFVLHPQRRRRGVHDPERRAAAAVVAARLDKRPSAGGDEDERGEERRRARDLMPARARAHDHPAHERRRSRDRRSDVHREQAPVRARRAGDAQIRARDRGDAEQRRGHRERGVGARAAQTPPAGDRQRRAEADVQQHVERVEERRRRRGAEICAVQQQEHETGEKRGRACSHGHGHWGYIITAG